MLLGSKSHTVGDTKLWTVKYGRWLANTATIQQIDVVSSSLTCTIGDPTVSGTDITFFLVDGELGETLTVSLTMTDSFGNIKHDTIAFTVVEP